MKSKNMSGTEVSEPSGFTCEFCDKQFKRESTLISHVCVYKHRWHDKDNHGNRVGFHAWLQFYSKNSMGKKTRTYENFIKNAYYTAFVKFGQYCVEINALNVSRFTDWLLHEKVKIDNWCKDSVYNRYLGEYLRVEDAFDAITRSIETTIVLAEEAGIQGHDYIRYGNTNKICYNITTGKISPWLLYMSDSGNTFLSELSEDQVRMISDYINIELWAIKFKREPDTVSQIKQLLTKGGF
jgi:hypothetical protein